MPRTSPGESREGLIKSVSDGSINFPFVPSAALARCIEGANGKHSPRTDLISHSLDSAKIGAVLTDQDDLLWLEFWLAQRTDFHQSFVNPLLSRFWSSLESTRSSRVFVPLCGKSLDMLWLSQQGHEVIGVELSPVAVEGFFRENGLHPVQTQLGRFTLWNDGKLSILCGDYFALTAEDIGHFDTVYDRASLTALPENIRGRYVEQLSRLVPKTAKVLLLTIEDAAEDATVAQANGIDAEITSLFTSKFDIDLAYVESVFELDPESPLLPAKRAEYKVYRLCVR